MTPDEYTNQEFFLDVGDGHQLYVHDWGNKEVKTPIVFLHGGPGAGCGDKNKTMFDPDSQRVIFHDQRGSGKSIPKASLEHNTTSDLIEDIEKVVAKLKLKKFILVGGSWGACLALAYTLKHPERIHSLVLRGIFTGSKAEIDWVAKGECRIFFPEVWEKYRQTVPKSWSEDPNGYHYSRILGDDKQASIKSAYAVSNFEGALFALDDRFTTINKDDYDPTLATIEAHYMANTCFMADRYILDNAHKIKAPVWLTQGRYDMICPPIAAYELDKQLPKSHLMWAVSGHRTEHENWNIQRTILSQLTER